MIAVAMANGAWRTQKGIPQQPAPRVATDVVHEHGCLCAVIYTCAKTTTTRWGVASSMDLYFLSWDRALLMSQSLWKSRTGLPATMLPA